MKIHHQQNITDKYRKKIYGQDNRIIRQNLAMPVADTIVLKSKAPSFGNLKNAQEYLNRTKKELSSIVHNNNFDIRHFNIYKLEGIQEGIPLFDGLSIKEISFIGNRLIDFALKRGCHNKCVHCFADAHPPLHIKDKNSKFINSVSWEDFQKFCNGFEELNKRLGFKIAKVDTASKNHIAPFYDSDCIDVILKDKSGQEHDLTEIIPMLYNATGKKILFDTAGWHPNNKKLQQRAEKYVRFFSNPKNEQYIESINISLNPFHSLNAKSIELLNSDPSRAEKFRNLYLQRMVNVIYTMSPLFDIKKFNIINRCAPYTMSVDDEFKKKSYKLLIKDIKNNLQEKYEHDIPIYKKIFYKITNKSSPLKQVQVLLDDISTYVLPLGRMEKLVQKNSMSIEKVKEAKKTNIIFSNSCHKNPRYELLIDANGKIYLTDEYTTFPTELQLNFENKDKLTAPLYPTPEKYVVTKKVINSTNINNLMQHMLKDFI